METLINILILYFVVSISFHIVVFILWLILFHNTRHDDMDDYSD